ncbi:adhesion G-protein coupled receptor D1-like [Dendronephthya gigantea]|uniref:adhesion G-protein coupled receptor D1-like n=1 Tax=Dendronephthya gigantea TaxID=151771 RepID=UPI00106A0FCD|nr:adhesion G-protein coupled receptor D1-like [Dendronephthya gigantea]
MSGFSWYIIVIICIIQSQVSFTYSQESSDGCRKKEKFHFSYTIKNSQQSNLTNFNVECSTQTVYEIRFTDGQLCFCGRITNSGVISYQDCRKTLPLNVMVNISVPQFREPWGENCTFFFIFKNGAQVQLDMKILPRRIVTSRAVTKSSVFTRFFTSYVASTVLSSAISNSMTESIQMSTTSTVINPQFTQTSIPHYTAIIIAPGDSVSTTSSLAAEPAPTSSSSVVTEPTSTTSSIKRSNASKTPSLVAEPALTTSSKNDVLKASSSAFIKGSPTSAFFPSSTLSPDGGNIDEGNNKFKEDIDFINNLNTSNVKINDKRTIKRVLDAAANLINTNRTAEDQNEDPGMQAVKVLEDLGNSISQQLALPENESSVTFQEVTEDLIFGVAVINSTISQGFSFPTDASEVIESEKIDIPSSVFVSESGKAYFVGIIFKPYREMRNKTGDFTVGTNVINAVVSPPPRKTLADPVEMTFKKNIIGETIASECSFWIENATYAGEHGGWSTKQCERTFENHSHIRCQCYHFTNFAVLFKISDNQDVSDEDTFRLVIITYVGLSLSILGCFLTFVIYVTLSNIKTDRAVIHTNLVLALGIADVIFLVTVVVKPVGDSCLALAMLAFYFYLAVFFWMLDEGVYIYLMVIKVFRGNDAMRRRMAYFVGWGCPAIIAIITWVVLRDDVVSKYHCWLSVESGAIWAFVGPGLLIILVNIIVLMIVMRTTWATFVDDKEYGGLKSATKTFGAVIPILGITWIFGVMAFNESSIVFQYIFAITNSLQGALIFILYCLVNNEVRNELQRKLAIWQTRRELSSSSAGARRTYPYVVSSEKNTTFNRTTTSAQATPDLYRYPMGEIKDGTSQGKVERKYSFEDRNKKPDFELELGKEEKNGGEKGKH